MYQHAVQAYLRSGPAVAEEGSAGESGDEVAENPLDKYRYQTPRKGQQYYNSQWTFVRDAQRRRVPGGGRHRSAAILRELLMDWYSTIRHSVGSNIMVRCPKQVLVVKGQMLQQEYLAACLRRSVQPEPVEMNSKWVTSLLNEYRISNLLPNRTYKVARWVLAERLDIVWLPVAKTRKLVLLHFGYDPE